MTIVDDTENNNKQTSSTCLDPPKQQHQTANNLEAISLQIEVVLHDSGAPITATDLKKHLSLFKKQLEQALDRLQQRLSTGVLSLQKNASGYRLQINNSCSALTQQVFPQRQQRLSQALLETLSVIVYKQLVTRSDIEYPYQAPYYGNCSIKVGSLTTSLKRH